VTADQLLNGYEAYRRGDRFYLRIPITSVPAADTIRGRAFSEVRVEQGPGGTVISFRLHPDATARVDQRGNKIEIVFVVSRPQLARAASANRAAVNSSGKRATTIEVSQNPQARIASKANSASTSKAVLATRATPANGTSAERHNDQVRPSESAQTANGPRPEAKLVKPGSATTAKKPAVMAQTASTEPNPAAVKESPNYWFSPAQINRLTVGLGVGLLLSLFGLVFLKKRAGKTRTLSIEPDSHDATEVETVVPEVTATVTLRTSPVSQSPMVGEPNVRQETEGSAISKLILDNTHRADVMNSRAPEDRKAIESSLLNILSAAETSDDERSRAREALEQYGFVAQYNATLLKGRGAWQRSSAARALGNIGSKCSLPFLIEALNDTDSVVRNEAVASIAALKDPAAIGALVEASRKHPDLAGSLLSQTLNVCSIDSVEWTDSSSEATATGQAYVPANDDRELVEPDDMRDGIISGWLALVDNPNDEANAQDVTSAYMLPQLERAPSEGCYLRIVA
jgi:hypothetical protein